MMINKININFKKQARIWVTSVIHINHLWKIIIYSYSYLKLQYLGHHLLHKMFLYTKCSYGFPFLKEYDPSLREGFNKKTFELMEFSIQILPPPPHPPHPLLWKKTFVFHNFSYFVIMFIIIKFGENFDEKNDICFF